MSNNREIRKLENEASRLLEAYETANDDDKDYIKYCISNIEGKIKKLREDEFKYKYY